MPSWKIPIKHGQWMMVAGKNHRSEWWVFQQAMFEYQRENSYGKKCPSGSMISFFLHMKNGDFP